MTSPTAAPLAAHTAVSTYSDSRPFWRTRRGAASRGGPDPRERALLAEPGLVLVPDLDLRAGVLLGDRRDVLDDDLLEELLGLGARVGVLRPRHQVAVAEPVQQLVDPVEGVAGGELLLQDPADVGAPQLADPVLGARRGVDPLQEAGLLVARQDGRCAAGVGPVGQRLQAAPVVGGAPRLDGAAADAQGAGDLRRGVALLGQDDGLHPGPGAGVAVSPGRLLQAVQRVVILDVHLRDVPTDPCP